MVISKCVPLEISRKKFSQFTEVDKPSEMIFVGYKYEYTDTDTKQKTYNVKMPYDAIKEDIKDYVVDVIKQDPEWGQGGSGGGGGDTPTPPEVEIYDFSAIPMACGFDWELELDEFGEPLRDEEGNVIPKLDEDGNPVIAKEEDGTAKVDITKSETWNDEASSNIINLADKKGFVEINAGGNYTEDYIVFANPVIGSITHVVVDNTGLPYNTIQKGEDIEGKTYDVPKDEFKLYYGRNTDNWLDATLIFVVPPMCRGVVQILHTAETDLVLYSSYTEVNDATTFVRDVQTDDEFTNDPIDKTPEGSNDATTFFINMDENKGYIDFNAENKEECTFVFSQPELGSNTYIVVTNPNNHDVKVLYGKYMDTNGNGIQDDKDELMISEITDVSPDEKCVIEVFHSLSADIIVKITKV